MKALKNLIKCESGMTSIEYGFIAILVSLVIIPFLPFMADQLNLTFDRVGDGFRTTYGE